MKMKFLRSSTLAKTVLFGLGISIITSTAFQTAALAAAGGWGRI